MKTNTKKEYTGVNDKNDKKIYFGDMVKFVSGKKFVIDSKNWWANHTFVVKKILGCACVCLYNDLIIMNEYSDFFSTHISFICLKDQFMERGMVVLEGNKLLCLEIIKDEI